MENEFVFNLLTENWLSVQMTSGNRSQISLNHLGSKEIKDVIAPRADFKGALYQLLIGLLQTGFTPQDKDEWLQYWCEPPLPDVLIKSFEPYLEAFNLVAPTGKPAFMQDFYLLDGDRKDIAQLLIEAPGGKTQKDNQDHFIKRGLIDKVSPAMAALALFTLQINAPAGGVGHRVSLRGGGPLTTLVLPPAGKEFDTLWHRLWLNVLTQEELIANFGDFNNTELDDIFPWVAPTRTSEKKGMETFPQHVNPLQHYWSMPRRIRLGWVDDAGVCDLSGEQSNQLCDRFETRNYGINYSGNWLHPLTPYSFEEGKESLSIKGQPGGLGYRNWLGLVYGEIRGKQKRMPATVVTRYVDRYYWISERQQIEFNPRLWAFGYDMDNMKARCWYESEMPIYNLNRDDSDKLVEHVRKIIEAASDVLKTLKTALKSAWFKRPSDAKGDISFIDSNFWSSTEPAFFRTLEQLKEHINDPEVTSQVLKQWHSQLTSKAHQIFDQYALSSLNEDGDLKRVIQARIGKGGLEHYLRGSKTMKQLAL